LIATALQQVKQEIQLAAYFHNPLIAEIIAGLSELFRQFSPGLLNYFFKPLPVQGRPFPAAFSLSFPLC